MGAESANNHLGDLGATPTLVPAFAALLQHQSPPTGAEPLRGDALHAVSVHLMRGLAAEQPLVWIVEDLHNADRDSRQLVLSLARATAGHRVLLVLTTRPGLPSGDLAHFGRVEGVSRSGLSRLGARDVILLLRDALKSERLVERLGPKIAVKSDGIPFFVFEMIRGLEEGQFITELANGSYVESKVIEEIEVPSAVRDLIEVRLGDLTKDQRALLDVGAVCGFTFDPDLVARSLDRPRVAVLQDLADIDRRSGVVRSDGPALCFDHHQIQEVVYGDMPEGLRKEYHALLATALAGREGVVGREPIDVPGELAHELASHHFRGSSPQEAVPFVNRALEHLLEAGRRDALLDIAGRALDAEGLLSDEQKVTVLLHEASGYDLLGDRGEQRESLGRASALLDRVTHPLLALQMEEAWGWLHFALGENEAAEKRFLQALGLVGECGDPAGECRVLGRLSNVSLELGRYDDARSYAARGLEVARRHEDRHSEGRAEVNVGLSLAALGRFDESIEHYEQSLRIAREVHDVYAEVVTSTNLGNALFHLGRLEEVEALRRRDLLHCRDRGDRPGEALATANLAVLLETRGRFAEARTHYERALETYREVGHARGEEQTLGNLANLFSSLGMQDAARSHFARGLALARRTGSLRLSGSVLHMRANSELRRGDLRRARWYCERAVARFRAAGQDGLVACVLDTLGLVLLRAGQVGEAVEQLEEGLILARQLGRDDLVVSMLAQRALLPGGSVEAAVEAFEEHEYVGDILFRQELVLLLWRATRDIRHLREAKHILDSLLEHAPEECRASMLEDVVLYREVAEAWAKHGEAS